MATWLSYVATLATAAVPSTIACLCVFAFVRRLGATDDIAACVALAYGLSTPLWAYATLLWGHALAASCLIAALYAADVLRTSAKPSIFLSAAIGFSAGFAVVTEYPSAFPAAVIVGLALWTAWSSGWRRFLTVGGGLLAGAGLAAAILLSYQWAAFGSPFHVGYASEEDPELLRAGFFGITTPKISVMGELLWGSFRGLLPLAPVLLVAPVGLWMLRRSAMKWTIAAGAASAIFYFLLNSAYKNWGGGWSYGPRHLAPAFAFVCIGLGPVLMRGGRFVRGIVLILAMVGAAESLIAVSTTVQPPPDYAQPMQQLLWPSFRDGKLSINPQSFLEFQPSEGATAAWNLGQLAGLTGKASLLPLFACWVIAGFAWTRIETPASPVTSKTSHARTRRSGRK
jgi:hypothetical protein